MALTSGTRLGPYEIQSPLGAGGMGEVYRARDTRLNRDVAVKILSAEFARDPERMWRFRQEAQAVAALNHPNILSIHDFGEHEGSPYIVTEFLDGETLRVRLGAGALPVRKTSEHAEQIARGLAAAHEKGIVHRDLKPENILVTRDGRVKILDFGLAKLSRTEEIHSDDVTLPSQTQAGVVMGTVGYMSPEQVRGKVADHRSDLFSFGAILYEMLSGKRAFEGDTSVEAMSAILQEDPPEFVETGRSVPAALDRIVRHCLEKNPEERFQSARDITFALAGLSSTGSAASAAFPAADGWSLRSWARLAAELAMLALAIGLLLGRRAEKPAVSIEAAILPPPGDGFWANITQPAAISPDGRFLAEIAMRNGHTQLWLRRIDGPDAQPIAGSEDAMNPFWSPDSRYVAFFVPGKLKKADVSGGSVTDICPSGRFGMGGAWSSRGVVIFSTFGEALKKVPDAGGVPEPISGTELSSGAVSQLWPAFLPDGTHFLYLDWRYPTNDSKENVVWVGSLDGEKSRPLPLTTTNARYSNGYLLFSHDGDLVAQKFDVSHLALSGAITPIARNTEFDTFFHDGKFTVSDTGVVVYGRAGVGVDTELTWMDRTGRLLGTLGEVGGFYRPAISPDGTRVAVGVKFADAREKIWIYDTARSTRIPLVNGDSGPSMYSPVWSPDGQRLAYRENLGKTSRLLLHNSDGSGEEKNPGSVEFDLLSPTDWSRDGHYLVLDLAKFQGRENWKESLRVINVDDGKSALELDDQAIGRFSPDGRWLAYCKERGGQLYVTPFPGPGARIAVSSTGGRDPRWRGDGKELYYVTDDQMLMSIQVSESSQQFQVLSSQALFRIQLPSNAGFYDVTRDGQRFLVNTRTPKEQAAPLTLLTDWTARIQERVAQTPKN
jgi:eukaryotic-like serine/threonine-protein kinase